MPENMTADEQRVLERLMTEKAELLVELADADREVDAAISERDGISHNINRYDTEIKKHLDKVQSRFNFKRKILHAAR